MGRLVMGTKMKTIILFCSTYILFCSTVALALVDARKALEQTKSWDFVRVQMIIEENIQRGMCEIRVVDVLESTKKRLTKQGYKLSEDASSQSYVFIDWCGK